jgi:hypothetical protein
VQDSDLSGDRLRRRLWLVGGGIGVFALVLVAAQVFPELCGTRPLAFGGDFLPAFAAGTLVRQGRPREVYSPAAMEQVERRIVHEARLAEPPFYGPYLNPPFFAAFFAPFSAIPYRGAVSLWLSLNLICAGAAIWLLCRMLDADGGWRDWGLAPLLVCVSMPFIQAVCHLQNSCVSLLLLSSVVALWRPGRMPILAGILAGLLSYKPQIACLVAAGLTVSLGWRAIVGFATTTTALAGWTAWQLPGAITIYVRQLSGLLHQIQERPSYNWGRQPTPMGFWRLLVQDHAGGPAQLPVLILVGLTIGCLALAWLLAARIAWRDRTGQSSRDGFIAATIACLPLLSPYYMDYDLLLLAIPVVLVVRSSREIGRSTVWPSATLFLALFVNPGISSIWRLNLAAPLVGLVAGITLVRCLRAKAESATVEQNEPPLALAA